MLIHETDTERQMRFRDALRQSNPDAYVYDGADGAIIGLVHLDTGSVLAYSRTAYIDILMARDGMSKDDAHEFFEFNVEGLVLGAQQPIIVDDDYAS